ncbi:MAG: PEP-CTERM sorting domain-containing protein [Betaproteobacteria bacterium]
MRCKHLARAGVVGALLCAAVSVDAASIIGDTFEASLTFDGTTYGPFSGVADSNAGTNNFFSGDGGLNGELSVAWVDDDSVDVAFFIGGLPGPLQNASFTLSGLDFLSGVEPRNIIGVTFNRAASNVDDFVEGFSLVGPDLSFTPTSISGTVSMSVGLAADGPRLRYDVIVAASSVPEPGSLALVLIGLGACSLISRGRNREAHAHSKT